MFWVIFENCFNHLVAVVHFHFWLFLDFRTVFVEIKLPILLYYWITYFFIRSNKGWWKVSVFPSSAVHFRTNAANTMTFLQREFLPSNDIKFHLYLLYCHSSSSYLITVQSILGLMQQTQWLSSKGNSFRQMTLKQQKLLLEILFFLHLFIHTKR